MEKTNHISFVRQKNGVTMDVEVAVKVFKEGKQYVAHAPMLDLTSHGRTRKQAEKHFKEVMKIFFEEVIAMGTLDEVLEELGWQKSKKSWEPPIEVKHIVTIPFRTMATAS